MSVQVTIVCTPDMQSNSIRRRCGSSSLITSSRSSMGHSPHSLYITLSSLSLSESAVVRC